MKKYIYTFLLVLCILLVADSCTSCEGKNSNKLKKEKQLNSEEKIDKLFQEWDREHQELLKEARRLSAIIINEKYAVDQFDSENDKNSFKRMDKVFKAGNLKERQEIIALIQKNIKDTKDLILHYGPAPTDEYIKQVVAADKKYLALLSLQLDYYQRIVKIMEDKK